MDGDLVCVHGPFSLHIEFGAVEESRAAVNVNIQRVCSTAAERLQCAVHDVVAP
jgi:hypothetical protein